MQNQAIYTVSAISCLLFRMTSIILDYKGNLGFQTRYMRMQFWGFNPRVCTV